MILCIPFYPLGYELILIPAGNNPDKPKNNRIIVLLRELQQLPPSRNIVKQCSGRTKKPINIPGSSRYAKFLRFLYIFSGDFRHKFYTQKEDPGIYTLNTFFIHFFLGWVGGYVHDSEGSTSFAAFLEHGIGGWQDGRPKGETVMNCGRLWACASEKPPKSRRKMNENDDYPPGKEHIPFKGSWGPMIFLFHRWDMFVHWRVIQVGFFFPFSFLFPDFRRVAFRVTSGACLFRIRDSAGQTQTTNRKDEKWRCR